MGRLGVVPSYEFFAQFYDAVQGDRAEHARYLRSLIRKHAARARTVLELACGTGSILKQLWTHYEVTGLDLSKEMLEIAAEKVPGVPLFRADMRTFDLGERFDVVLCVYDSINHLLRFDEWKTVFARAHDHLNEEGVFIFDINTVAASRTGERESSNGYATPSTSCTARTSRRFRFRRSGSEGHSRNDSPECGSMTRSVPARRRSQSDCISSAGLRCVYRGPNRGRTRASRR